ncbi:MAG: hypothetical protein DRO65_02625 [Candidatus Altiarchaeales archaeon]|nr:MAG: hypothetical protein DRO65_02625 [Candidatus Altiarchaeales archaeon]
MVATLSISDPRRIQLNAEVSKEYPRKLVLKLYAYYYRSELEREGKTVECFGGFHVLTSSGYISLSPSTSSEKVRIRAYIYGVWNPSSKPRYITIVSDPLSRKDLSEIDETLGVEDINIYWSIEGYGFVEGVPDLARIHVWAGEPHRISRKDFVTNVLEKVDMLRRAFLEVIVEPIDLRTVRDSRIKTGLTLLLEKQKLLLEAMRKLPEASTSTDFRGVIDEVRRVVEGIKRNQDLCELCKEAYMKLGLVEATDSKIVEEAAEEIIASIIGSPKDPDRKLCGLLETTFYYASRIAIHATTLSGEPYTPCPNRAEAEFAVQQALVELNYLIRLLKRYNERL